MTDFAAIDLGASSGRVVCGRFDGGVIALEECHRFANRPVRLPDGLRWNLLHLFTEAVGALRGRTLDGVGVDTWGVDYALLDERQPRARSPLPLPRRAHRRCRSASSGYEITGIQDMPINTVYQLLADDRVGEAHAIALVPDLLAYWLSGELANERTNASTTGLLDARTGEWSLELIERLGLPTRPFGALVEPGTQLGPRARAPRDRRARLHRRLARHRLGLRRRAAARRARGDPVLRHLVAARPRAAAARSSPTPR